MIDQRKQTVEEFLGQHQNPTIGTLNRSADALGKRVSFQVVNATKRRTAAG